MKIENIEVLRHKYNLVRQLYSDLEKYVPKDKAAALYSMSSRAITDELERIQDAILKEVLEEDIVANDDEEYN